jgi:hypothetical protein
MYMKQAIKIEGMHMVASARDNYFLSWAKHIMGHFLRFLRGLPLAELRKN